MLLLIQRHNKGGNDMANKWLDKGLKAVQKGVKDFGESVAPQIGKGVMDAAGNAGEIVAKGTKAVTSVGKNATDAVMNQLDVNHDGTVDIADIITLGLKTPGVRVDREEFLRKEFKIHYSEETVAQAIEKTPAIAGIPADDIDKIADDVIQYERYFVSGISAALGTPGGAAMAATIPADIIQYYGYMLRTAQKLMYLYGFPQIVTDEEETQIDSATMNLLIIAMGVMFGVAGANNAIKAMAKALGNGVQKQLMKQALTKGTVFPIVKGVAKWFGVRMTKEIFTGFFKKAIPVVGGVIGGGITYASFKPCCDRLKDNLKDTKLSNLNHEENEEETEIYDAIVTEVDETDEE